MTDGLCLARKTLGIYSDCKSTCSNWLKKIRNWGWISIFEKKRWFFRTEEWAIKLAMTMHTLDAAHVTTHCAASRQRRKVSIENHIQTWNETSRQASVDELNYLNKSWPSRPREGRVFPPLKNFASNHISTISCSPFFCFSTSTNIDSFFRCFSTWKSNIANAQVLFPRPRQVFVRSSVALFDVSGSFGWGKKNGQEKNHGKTLD